MLIRQSLPSLANDRLSLLALLLRKHLLDDRHLFAPVEAISCQEAQLASRLHCLVVLAVLDAVDLVTQLIDALLHELNLVEMLFLALLRLFFVSLLLLSGEHV